MNQHRRVRSDEGLIARSFKSGNSVALRLPKELGFQPGEEVIITDHKDGTFSLRRADGVEDKAETLNSLFGSFSSGFMAEGRGDIEQGPRSWDPPEDEQAVD